MPSSAVLCELDGPPGLEPTRFRQAGENQVLIEYGGIEVDLRLNFRVHALLRQLDLDPVDGLVAASAGFRSVLLTFDPDAVSRDALLKTLLDREQQVPDLASLVLPSRVVRMPIAFDDELTRQAVHRYRITTRQDAPNVRDGDNIDYIVRYNGFRNREEFFDRFVSTTWWNAFIGYFPGLPSLFSMDPLAQISVPKYNPARMWTAEGAVGLGGPCVVLYPMESPGGYQLFGRTLPLRDVGPTAGPTAGSVDEHGRQRTAAQDAAASHLFVAGDRVQFTRVSEEELLALRLQVFEGSYAYDVEVAPFAVADYLEVLDRAGPQASRVGTQRAEAARSVEIP